ncbi:hypothetical protein B0H13DRAFT_2462201 [Mycena leptocephala]|nr:hypothetical protein B0H13DRAFT_2462201 [Mycena leptocephala]
MMQRAKSRNIYVADKKDSRPWQIPRPNREREMDGGRGESEMSPSAQVTITQKEKDHPDTDTHIIPIPLKLRFRATRLATCSPHPDRPFQATGGATPPSSSPPPPPSPSPSFGRAPSLVLLYAHLRGHTPADFLDPDPRLEQQPQRRETVVSSGLRGPGLLLLLRLLHLLCEWECWCECADLNPSGRATSPTFLNAYVPAVDPKGRGCGHGVLRRVHVRVRPFVRIHIRIHLRPGCLERNGKCKGKIGRHQRRLVRI